MGLKYTFPLVTICLGLIAACSDDDPKENPKPVLPPATDTMAAYAKCNTILAEVLYHDYQRVLSYDARYKLKRWMCSGDGKADNSIDSFTDKKQTYLPIFHTEEETLTLESWKEKYCHQDDRLRQPNQLAFPLINYFTDETPKGWAQCMQQATQSPVACYAQSPDPFKPEMLKAYLQTQESQQPLSELKITLENLTALSHLPDSLKGNQSFDMQKDDMLQSALFSLNVRQGKEPISCSFTIPTALAKDKMSNEGINDCAMYRDQLYQDKKITQRAYETYVENNNIPVFHPVTGKLFGSISCAEYIEMP
ncbi:hypothetical protein [Algicola sagamiensis]|uniref:hypothetical protein n=1 Tax=Algicola sagamiensis TaxID=163869 RepID=UPI000373A0A5|nr:hypothetical protein [Algicola sagamiensis]